MLNSLGLLCDLDSTLILTYRVAFWAQFLCNRNQFFFVLSCFIHFVRFCVRVCVYKFAPTAE